MDFEKTGVLTMLERISESFGDAYVEDIGRGILFLRNQYGSGKIKAFELAGGISCLFYNIEFRNDLEFTFNVKEKRHLYFNDVHDGYFDNKMVQSNVYRRIGGHRDLIVEADSQRKTFTKLPKNVSNSSNRLGVENAIQTLTEELTASLSLGKDQGWYTYFGNYGLDILRTVKEFFVLKTRGAVDRILNDTLIHKILGHQLEEHELNKQRTSKYEPSSKQLEGIDKTDRFIENNLSKK